RFGEIRRKNGENNGWANGPLFGTTTRCRDHWFCQVVENFELSWKYSRYVNRPDPDEFMEPRC
ncbi:hypothetical protein HAX54_050112, partial [Datura stramonium]|nr:hypothetical protein [Datura stramonium]